MSNATRADLYISPSGDDEWSGHLAESTADGTDGPLATLGKARDVLRRLKNQGKLSGPVTVLLRGGRYPLIKPVTFTPEDSWPVVYKAYPGEQPVLDGGEQIEGWRVETMDGNQVWVTDIPEVAQGKWYFKQLFVNGERRNRTRLPREGMYSVEGVPEIHSFSPNYWGAEGTFYCAPGDIKAWENFTDIDVVALHRWVAERLPLASFDEETRLVKSSLNCIFPLENEHSQFPEYYVENVKEALNEPGEWYLDRPTGQLYYIPMPGEVLESVEVYAPRAEQLIKLTGCPEDGQYVEHLSFKGLRFEHTEWTQPSGGGERWGELYQPLDYATAPQGACHIPGAISLSGARYCAIKNCTIAHIGWSGIELTAGCQGIHIVNNTITDLGAGGIKIESRGIPNSVCEVEYRTGNNQITDNHIYAGGRVFHEGHGIHSMDSFGNDISHNHIHDFFYSGISCGWNWGYEDNISRDNHIEKNHIHDIGHGLLSDMGCIYTLGVQPGTVVRGNLVHDVKKAVYGGWGIYLDEGSSHILVENNISYNVNSEPYTVHYGRENIVRNNIFAFGREAQVRLGRDEEHIAYTFEKNIVITDGLPLYTGGRRWKVERTVIRCDLNLFWDVSGTPMLSGSTPHGLPQSEYTMEQWQKLGYDLHSIIADPKCRDLSRFDFTLDDDSPALSLGFKPIDMSDVGPRPSVD